MMVTPGCIRMQKLIQGKRRLNRMKRSLTAFTLIELLIVVAIIGILAAIAVPNFLNAQVRAKIARVESDHKAIGTALGMYSIDRNAFPPFLNFPQFAARGVPELTTPVAYIATYPIDPFEWTVEGSGLTGGLRYTKMAYYNLDIMEKTGQARGSSVFGVAEYRQGFRWIVRSIGPNRQFDYDASNNVFPYYDASNGLNSYGDIYTRG